MLNSLQKYKHLDIYIVIIASIITVIYAGYQVIHTHHTKDIDDIKPRTVLVAIFANLLIMIHGCFIQDNLILIGSAAMILLNIYRLYQYYCFKDCDKENIPTTIS